MPGPSSAGKPPSSKATSSPTQEEQIWYKDVPGFLNDRHLVRFVPLPGTPLAQQLNAVLRFALLYGALLFVFRQSYGSVYVPLVTAAVTYFLYSSDDGRQGSMREAMDSLELEPDPVTNRLCTRPTLKNPFMNVLVSDYQRFPERPAACDVTLPSVAKRAEQYHNHNLYRDSDDVFERQASSRQFYTTASTTIPNDQTAFAEWLYKIGPTCKEASGNCASVMYKHRP
jgi:hypothetical protein